MLHFVSVSKPQAVGSSKLLNYVESVACDSGVCKILHLLNRVALSKT